MRELHHSSPLVLCLCASVRWRLVHDTSPKINIFSAWWRGGGGVGSQGNQRGRQRDERRWKNEGEVSCYFLLVFFSEITHTDTHKHAHIWGWNGDGREVRINISSGGNQGEKRMTGWQERDDRRNKISCDRFLKRRHYEAHRDFGLGWERFFFFFSLRSSFSASFPSDSIRG